MSCPREWLANGLLISDGASGTELPLAGCAVLSLLPTAFGQEAAHKPNLVIVEGDGAINNIRQRTAREPIVQVEDEDHKPVAGAVVLFLLPERGAGGTFADGSHSLSVVTDSQGRAVAHGLHGANVKGQFQVRVKATLGGMTASSVITQTTEAGAGGAGATGRSGSDLTKVIATMLVAATAAAAGGAYYATHSGGGNSATIAAGTSITAGAGSVGRPK